MLLSYLAQPGFAGERLAEQVLGPARLELLQLSDREVYFAVPGAPQAIPLRQTAQGPGRDS